MDPELIAYLERRFGENAQQISTSADGDRTTVRKGGTRRSSRSTDASSGWKRPAADSRPDRGPPRRSELGGRRLCGGSTTDWSG